MSYRIYIGLPEDLENSKELFSFNKSQHEELFFLLENSDINYNWLSELKDYYEFMNYTFEEVKILMLEIQRILENPILEQNIFLCCLLQATKEVISKKLQLMCVGD
jgi:hypothetical protein